MHKIKPKRSYTANAVPVVSGSTPDIERNEIAINWADSKLYTRNNSDQLVSITLGGGGGGSSEDARWEYFKPAAPTGVTATATSAQAVVSWTAPAIVVPPVTDYVVQFSTNGGSTWTTATDAVSTATTATITGLANSVAHVFRVAGINGIGTGAYSTASAAVTPVAGDPLFASVSLLLPMDGTGATFVDVSATPKTVTANGNATQSTAQSKWGGKSAFFNGTSDSLSFPDLGIGTGDFTIEMWLKTASTVQYAQLIGNEGSGGSEGFSLLINNDSASGGQVALYRGGVIVVSSPSGDFSDDQWHYIAVSRSGSTVRIYLDGTLASTGTSSGSFTSSAATFVARNNVFSPRNVVGYIDDLRITVGSARGYTGATITVPTAAFPAPMSAPTSLTATAGNAQVSLTWTAPSYNGGSAITDYSVQFSSDSGSTWGTFSRTSSTTASQVVTGLTNGTAYVFRVAGINSNGTGTYSSAVSGTPIAVSPPTAVRNLVASEQGQGNNVSWLAPLSDGGSAITGYRVVITGNSVNAGTTTQSASQRTKFVDSTGRNAFTVTVYAVNAVGESPGVTVSGETGDNS